MKDWIAILIPVALLAGGFIIQTSTLQNRVEVIEEDRRTKGAEALENLRLLEDRVLSIELKCECSD